MGSWQMNVAVLCTCVAWTVQALFYVKQIQILIPNATGLFIQSGALLIRLHAKSQGWSHHRREIPLEAGEEDLTPVAAAHVVRDGVDGVDEDVSESQSFSSGGGEREGGSLARSVGR